MFTNHEPEQIPAPSPPRPWYERTPAPLRPEEVDNYDRQMAPERSRRRPKLFL